MTTTPNPEQQLAQSLVTDAIRRGENIETYVRKATPILSAATQDRIVALALASNLR
jgi:hypothetical protein